MADCTCIFFNTFLIFLRGLRRTFTGTYSVSLILKDFARV
jgi:hypothetical protein